MNCWDSAEKWYNNCVGEKGHYYHRSLILPNILRMLDLPQQGSLLDLGCGQGILARHLPDSIEYCGIDLSTQLIKEAKRLTTREHCTFHVGDVTSKIPVEKTNFDRVSLILSLQNIENGEKAIQCAACHLKQGGRLLLLLNHPCFRIPRQSGWGVDEKGGIQYRRMNCYLSSMKIPLQVHPGKGTLSEIVYSYHHPLSDYVKWLSKTGFAITEVEEWCSDKKSKGPKARMENRARREIPLFLALGAAFFGSAIRDKIHLPST